MELIKFKIKGNSKINKYTSTEQIRENRYWTMGFLGLEFKNQLEIQKFIIKIAKLDY